VTMEGEIRYEGKLERYRVQRERALAPHGPPPPPTALAQLGSARLDAAT